MHTSALSIHRAWGGVTLRGQREGTYQEGRKSYQVGEECPANDKDSRSEESEKEGRERDQAIESCDGES